jgi:hypothetical protein
MRDANHQDDQPFVLDADYDSIIADPVAPVAPFLSHRPGGELARVWWVRTRVSG